MLANPYQQYHNNSVLTASGPELTLMLYNGAIKFCNQAIEAINQKDIPRSHENITKAENIIDELRITLNMKYPVSNEIEKMYIFINELLVQGNIRKDTKKIEDALYLIREFRDAWQETMKGRRNN